MEEKTKDAFIIARVPVTLKKALEDEAGNRGISVSKLIRELLDNNV